MSASATRKRHATTKNRQALAKRPNLRVVPTTPKLFDHIPETRVRAYSDALLRSIRQELGNAVSITREDLMQLKVFDHIATITKYRLIGTMVKYLAARAELIHKSRTNMCLIAHEKAYDDTPLHQQYYDTICAIVASLHPRTRTSIMDIVALWRTDPQLTINNKRVAVRGAITRLIKEGRLRRHDEFEFVVLKAR